MEMCQRRYLLQRFLFQGLLATRNVYMLFRVFTQDSHLGWLFPFQDEKFFEKRLYSEIRGSTLWRSLWQKADDVKVDGSLKLGDQIRLGLSVLLRVLVLS